MLILFIAASTSCGKVNKNDKVKYVDIYNVVNEVFLTDKGYSNELSKHVSQEVFEKTNIYNSYPVNSIEYKRPFKVDFSLKEDSQSKINDLIYVKMIYSVKITDSQNKAIGGSLNIPITFTVENKEDGWYITKKEEPA